MTIGKADRKSECNTIAVNDFCLLNCAKYAGEWPQLAKVVDICQSGIKFLWYKGSKTSPWTPCSVPAPGCRGKKMPWQEIVHAKDILCYGLNLTGSSKFLRKLNKKIDNYQDF